VATRGIASAWQGRASQSGTHRRKAAHVSFWRTVFCVTGSGAPRIHAPSGVRRANAPPGGRHKNFGIPSVRED
jgi:hypothetical protein